MVRGAFSARVKAVAAVALAIACGLRAAGSGAQTPAPIDVAAIADALLWGRPWPAAARTADRIVEMPPAAQTAMADYRRREAAFKSTLTPPPGATAEEQRVFAQRVGIERVVFSLFDRRDSARVAAIYALDADLGFTQTEVVDGMLRNLTQKWLAPYLNLVAGDMKLCAGRDADGRRQLAAARDGGQPLIRLVAEQLLLEKRCFVE